MLDLEPGIFDVTLVVLCLIIVPLPGVGVWKLLETFPLPVLLLRIVPIGSLINLQTTIQLIHLHALCENGSKSSAIRILTLDRQRRGECARQRDANAPSLPSLAAYTASKHTAHSILIIGDAVQKQKNNHGR